MRRSQRLSEKKSLPYAALNERLISSSDKKKTEISTQIEKGSSDNGCATNEVDLPQVPAVADENSNEGKRNFSSILSENVKNQVEGKMNKNEMDNQINTQTSSSKLKQPIRGRPTTKRVRNKSASKANTNNQQSKRRRLSNIKKEAPIISIDHYLNPLRHPLLQPETTTELMENNDFKCYNNIPNINLNSTNNSLLPKIYPMHFVNQNFGNTSIDQPPLAQVLPTPMTDTNVQQQQNHHFPTPELTQSLDFESSTSTLSLPESLHEVFGCNDIREILKMDTILFRIRSLHLQTLAFILNISYEYLYALLEKIMQLDSETMQKIIYAFKPLVDTINSQNENNDV